MDSGQNIKLNLVLGGQGLGDGTGEGDGNDRLSGTLRRDRLGTLREEEREEVEAWRQWSFDGKNRRKNLS